MRTFLYRLKLRAQNALKKKVDDAIIFDQGYDEFIKTGITPVESYHAFIRMYCKTNGKLFEDRHREIIKSNPPHQQHFPVNGHLGSFNKNDFQTINDTLNKEGYTDISGRIPEDMVKRLRDWALKTPATVAPSYDKPTLYDAANPVSEIYRFSQQDQVNNHDIQRLMMDPVFINIAREYLQCEPIFDFPAMWWSTPFLKKASAEAAQLYHFDLDRLKWLKIFVYLTDVDDNNGPHRLVKGSHIVGAKPDSLLKRGYARIPDEDLTPHYKKEDFVCITGTAGSVFAEDTKCWHKGTPLVSGHRLVLEFEYTSSMFGANYPKFEIKNPLPEFREFCLNNPVYASNIKFN